VAGLEREVSLGIAILHNKLHNAGITSTEAKGRIRLSWTIGLGAPSRCMDEVGAEIVQCGEPPSKSNSINALQRRPISF
jgi:hypothetical protein